MTIEQMLNGLHTMAQHTAAASSPKSISKTKK
jgi:hypothetical protein